MPDRSHTSALIEHIRNELKCVSCGYEFRGLEGEFITCPECGRKHNIANMVAHAWRGRWYQAPGFNLLALPLAAPIALCFVIGISGVMFQHQLQVFNAIVLVSFVLAVLVWIYLIAFVTRKYKHPLGLLLTFMIQLIFPLYLIGAVVGLRSLSALGGLSGGFWGMKPQFGFLLAMFAVILAWIVQRLFARMCIRLYVRRIADEGIMRV